MDAAIAHLLDDLAEAGQAHDAAEAEHRRRRLSVALRT